MCSKAEFVLCIKCVAAMVAVTCAGCVSTRMTDTARTGVEQLLVSHAIDASLDKVEFSSLSGAAVFVDEKFLDCIDKKYVVASVRQRTFQAGCRLVDKPDEADIVLELFCGAVGTDRSEGFIGTPAITVPGPLPIQVPDIKLLSQTTQYGTAKIGIVAYDPKSRQALSAGGLARSRSNNTNWSVLGIGPFTSGTVKEEVALAHARGESTPRISLLDRPGSMPAARADSQQIPVISHGVDAVQQIFPELGSFRPGVIPTWPAVQTDRSLDNQAPRQSSPETRH